VQRNGAAGFTAHDLPETGETRGAGGFESDGVHGDSF
jgi:hypothetical protein